MQCAVVRKTFLASNKSEGTAVPQYPKTVNSSWKCPNKNTSPQSNKVRRVDETRNVLALGGKEDLLLK